MSKYYERLDNIQFLCFCIALFDRINRKQLHIGWLESLEPLFILNGIVFYLCCIGQIYITWREHRSIKAAIMHNKFNVFILLFLTCGLCYFALKN